MSGRPRFGSVTSAAIAFALVVALAGAMPVAAHDAGIRVGGRCTGSSVWSLKLAARDGKIGLVYEVDSGVAGQRWNVTVVHRGRHARAAARFAAVTHRPDGSFTIRRLVRDYRGADAFRIRAVQPRTGEVCAGGAAIA